MVSNVKLILFEFLEPFLHSKKENNSSKLIVLSIFRCRMYENYEILWIHFFAYTRGNLVIKIQNVGNHGEMLQELSSD